MEKTEIISNIINLWCSITFGSVLSVVIMIINELMDKTRNKRQSQIEEIQKALDEEHLEKYGWTKESRTYVCPEESATHE